MKKILMCVFLCGIFLSPDFVFAVNIKETFPKKANYFLHWEISDSDAVALSQWDLLIIDMEVQVRSPGALRKIRRLNPNVVILAYITPQEIRKDADVSGSVLRKHIAENLPKNSYLKNSRGEILSWWSGTYLLNVTNNVSVYPEKRFNYFLPHFVKEKILSTGLWDGVFYDNAWDSITFFAGKDIDLNNDRRIDLNIDTAWQTGMKQLYDETRRIVGQNFIIVGNGLTRVYRDHLNGNMIENFLPVSWGPTMQTYKFYGEGGPKPQVDVINANSGNGSFGGQNNYAAMRFGLGSSLLGDGFYSFDHGDRDHGQLWWYDEYGSNLGTALGSARLQQGEHRIGVVETPTQYGAGVYVRQFQNGIALVNSTGEKQHVELGGEYEKFHGVQDPAVNDGSIVTETDLNTDDGLILLKTFSSLNDALFTNGDFVRFFRPDGTRVRNGFFAFEDAYKGGDQIAHVDLDGNGVRDLIVVSKNKITIWRDDGQLYAKLYPYTASYSGTLQLAFGDTNGDGRLEMVVAPGAGYSLPVQIYSRSGTLIAGNWFPFGAKYVGGYSLGVLGGGFGAEGKVVVGTGVGLPTKIQLYNANFTLFREWFAYEKYFTGGVHVAVGDIDGDGVEEIVAGAGEGKKPLIKVFDASGGLKFGEFQAYSTFGTPGIDVEVTDVNFDGKKEIVGLSDGI